MLCMGRETSTLVLGAADGDVPLFVKRWKHRHRTSRAIRRLGWQESSLEQLAERPAGSLGASERIARGTAFGKTALPGKPAEIPAFS